MASTLAEAMVEAGLVTEEQLAAGREDQQNVGGRLGQALIRLGFVTEDGLTDFYAELNEVPLVNLHEVNLDPRVVELLPREEAARLPAIPVQRKGRTLVVAVSDPMIPGLVDTLQKLSRHNVELVCTYAAAIRQKLEQLRTRPPAPAPVSSSIEVSPSIEVKDDAPAPLPPDTQPGVHIAAQASSVPDATAHYLVPQTPPVEFALAAPAAPAPRVVPPSPFGPPVKRAPEPAPTPAATPKVDPPKPAPAAAPVPLPAPAPAAPPESPIALPGPTPPPAAAPPAAPEPATVRSPKELAALLEQVLLKPDATRADVSRACEEARRLGFAAVAINACHTAYAARLLDKSEVKLVAVVGFPYGLAPAAAKAIEAAEAVKAGASEIALVTHPTALRTRDYAALTAEIAAAVAAAAPAKVRAVLEVGPLGREEKVIACALARSAGAESVATGTGAGLGGPVGSVEDVALLRSFVGSEVPVHAAAARNAEEAGRLLDAGATRVGVVAGTAAAMMTRRGRA